LRDPSAVVTQVEDFVLGGTWSRSGEIVSSVKGASACDKAAPAFTGASSTKKPPRRC